MSILDQNKVLRDSESEIERLRIVDWCKTYIRDLFLDVRSVSEIGDHEIARDVVSFVSNSYLNSYLKPQEPGDTNGADLEDSMFHISCTYCFLDKDLDDNWIICPVKTTYPVPIFNYYGSELPDFIRFSVQCHVAFVNYEPSKNFGYLPRNRRP